MINCSDRRQLEELFDPDLREFLNLENEVNEILPTRYIINDDATILFWSDGDKTIVKKTKNDTYDKRLGFLYAYFQKTSGLSRSKANKYIENLVEIKNKNQIREISRPLLSYEWNKVCKAYQDGVIKGKDAAKKLNMSLWSFYYNHNKEFGTKYTKTKKEV
jgi:RNase P subunit RPR2